MDQTELLPPIHQEFLRSLVSIYLTQILKPGAGKYRGYSGTMRIERGGSQLGIPVEQLPQMILIDPGLISKHDKHPGDRSIHLRKSSLET